MKTGKVYRKEKWIAYLFITPILLQFCIFTVGPAIYSVYISLTDWSIMQEPAFIGLQNYRQLLSDSHFWKAAVNTLYYMACIPIGLIISFFLALLFNRPIRGRSFFRLAYYLPFVSSVVAIAIVWQWILNKDFGLLNYLLSLVGVEGPGWLSDERWTKPSIMLLILWRMVGVNALFYLAALQAIPRILHEAAMVDGAGSWQRLWKISIPLLTPATFFLVVTGIFNISQVFVEISIMTGDGGVNFSTASLVFYIMQKAFSYSEMGYASAIAWVLGFLLMVVTWIQFRVAGRWVQELN
jgi:multiple sugar transport system permease protein